MTARMREIAQLMMRSATVTQSAEDQQISLITARMREMSVENPAAACSLRMCTYHDRPSGDCGYAEGEIELADGTRHRCSGSVIKGALNGLCVITITTPEDSTPVEVTAIFNLGYAVGIVYMQWPDGLLMQVTLEDSVLVTTGHDRYVFASFPSADPALSFQRPSNHEFVVFMEPPTDATLLGAHVGHSKSLDISRSCHFVHTMKSYVISSFNNGGGKVDKSIVIAPEDATTWLDVVRNYTTPRATLSDPQENFRIFTGAGTLSPPTSPIASVGSSATKLLPSDDHDFTLWCLILMQLESWQPERKSREVSKLDVGAANAVNQKREAWNLFEYKMSDPSHSILINLIVWICVL
jgi:hypothetical protein